MGKVKVKVDSGVAGMYEGFVTVDPVDIGFNALVMQDIEAQKKTRFQKPMVLYNNFGEHQFTLSPHLLDYSEITMEII